MSSSTLFFVLCVAFLCLIPWSCLARRGGGGGRGGGGRASSGRSSSSGSSWGSSSSSGSRTSSSSGWGSSSSSGSATRNGGSGTGSATKWGSSAPSGSSNRYSSSGGFGSKPAYGSGAAYRAPTKTMSRISSTGVARPNYNRPQARIPTSSYSAVPTRVVYSTTYTTYSGRRGFSGTSLAMGMMGGYLLGSMMSRVSRPWGYGYGGYGYGSYYGPSPYSTYVPYHDRYQQYVVTTPSPVLQQATTPRPKRDVDLCTLARWNREIPYTETPNMVLDFIANDTITGPSSADKGKFVYEFFREIPVSYSVYNATSDVFTIPTGYDLKKQCNFLATENVDVTKPASGGPEEPILTAARNVIMLYSNISKSQDDLNDVVAAAHACLPQGEIIAHPEVIPCLDFSMTPDQLLNLEEPNSIFGNGEICRRQLNPDMFKCVPDSSSEAKCKMEHLVALNMFARNFYLCTDELEKATAQRLEERRRSEESYYGSGSVLCQTKLQVLLWTLVSAVLPKFSRFLLNLR